MPVAPFGSPIDPLQWAEFRDRTGVPVVIDAAAGFDAARPSSVPTVVSLHATKTLGIGEGALVLHADPAAIGDIRARANFGFAASRAFIRHAWDERVRSNTAAPQHPKSALQEWAAAHNRKPPAYEVVDRSGPPHAPRFTIEVRLPGHDPEAAQGGSKREAEKAAAALMLSKRELEP